MISCGTRQIPIGGSGQVGAGSTYTTGFAPNTTGTISASVDWASSGTSGQWSSSVDNFGTYDRQITASAGGTLSATVSWPVQVPLPDMDIFILHDGQHPSTVTLPVIPG